MNGTLMLYLDQYGNHFYARTDRELREKVGSSGSRIAKMYVENGADGEPRHVGYVIAGHWLKMFAPIELPVNLLFYVYITLFFCISEIKGSP